MSLLSSILDLCVYDNVEGWQNDQFWGRSEFALEFGDYTVDITVPADHVMQATGVLTKRKGSID